MDLPEETDLPFFSYGIFKPGQLGYFQIKEFVEDCSSASIPADLYERDGIPLLHLSKNRQINGYILTFSSGNETKAYKKIVATEPDKHYKWDTTEICNAKVNLLTGKKVGRGCSYYESSEWDGSKDPLFNEALEMIDGILNSKADQNENHRHLDYSIGINEIFRLQMAYMLLWSAIERYGSLKYGLKTTPDELKVKLSQEPAFTNGLQESVKYQRRVFRTDEPEKNIILDPENPKKSIEYYYQVRCNVVHRGKTVFNDIDVIRDSLTELLAIFRAMLDESIENSKHIESENIISSSN